MILAVTLRILFQNANAEILVHSLAKTDIPLPHHIVLRSVFAPDPIKSATDTAETIRLAPADITSGNFKGHQNAARWD
jgi:hypothetical protein